ncbi:MAG: 23S rRNA (pseudouridine(1915)-N(3))-methyltransferase RlmH [Eubacterium coprostanoligenes]|uniref:23S rRNA (pseudouridine(1915)-N(3))-methyltransferase RlmH n=1 Tax=Eubacterium coprostanoligenes TaxID=290054 RepID=UPI0023571D5E|nr:23S rRNA (pseudouridine(1915)-N(3))-methyltransferase RlmH [Eubacterium coprostanoligenes]MCI7264971.1 23S rRNA (pseudouridine(1915)-N(3))-methyltransferase RlmH [Eubacterium coprostanoligenes]MDD6664723.1 23S rRNA (pseudouridine(1915)-N(3))-methyltransferase RlmH [Eubacterium coprostanoligenes]
MKVTVIAVGKLKEKYLRDACEEYLKRLGTYSKVSVVEVNEERCSDNPSESEIENVKQKEGQRIIAKIPKGSFVVPMCIEGTQFSSEDFAKKIEATAVAGNSDITFIIGGSFGLSDEVKSLGKLKLSFGKLTLPHQLMRVVLLEQIYRAFSILNNSKYHK